MSQVIAKDCIKEIGKVYQSMQTDLVNVLQKSLNIGRMLEGIRAECEGHGKRGQGFAAVCEELPFNRQSAYRFIKLWERFGQCHASATQLFEYKAAEKFLPKSVPDEAVDEAIAMAERGKRITVPVANEIIKPYRPEKKFDLGDVLSHINQEINEIAERVPKDLYPHVVAQLRTQIEYLESLK